MTQTHHLTFLQSNLSATVSVNFHLLQFARGFAASVVFNRGYGSDDRIPPCSVFYYPIFT